MLESIIALAAALGVALTGYTLALILANWWADQWYDADGSPHHCDQCCSPWLDNTPYAHGGVLVHCSGCTAFVGAINAEGVADPFWRDCSVDEVMVWGRWLGPLLAVGGALCLAW